MHRASSPDLFRRGAPLVGQLQQFLVKSCGKRKPRLADSNAFFDKPAGFRVDGNSLRREFIF